MQMQQVLGQKSRVFSFLGIFLVAGLASASATRLSCDPEVRQGLKPIGSSFRAEVNDSGKILLQCDGQWRVATPSSTGDGASIELEDGRACGIYRVEDDDGKVSWHGYITNISGDAFSVKCK